MDLENPEDLAKLDNPGYFFEINKNKLICIDEIQRAPELFPIIRVTIDKDRRAKRFLLLGSASQKLMQQSTETLAGRISYHRLGPFSLKEVQEKTALETLWIRGGFPDSLLANSEATSIEWRKNFITTFLEKNLNEFGKNFSPVKMRRFWQMLSHDHGQVSNF